MHVPQDVNRLIRDPFEVLLLLINQDAHKYTVDEFKEELAVLEEQRRLLDSFPPQPPYQDLTYNQRVQKLEEIQERIINVKNMIASQETQTLTLGWAILAVIVPVVLWAIAH